MKRDRLQRAIKFIKDDADGWTVRIYTTGGNVIHNVSISYDLTEGLLKGSRRDKHYGNVPIAIDIEAITAIEREV